MQATQRYQQTPVRSDVFDYTPVLSIGWGRLCSRRSPPDAGVYHHVAHPQNSADYCRVESLLQDTLASLSQQSCDDYRMIIVGNRRPAFPLPERAIFVDVNFPPPSDLKGPQTGPAPVIWDKGTKIAIGLIAARDFGPEYVMAVDADDFVL